MSEIDLDAFFREQDKRMNMPEDDFEEYLDRMGSSRKKYDILYSVSSQHLRVGSREDW